LCSKGTPREHEPKTLLLHQSSRQRITMKNVVFWDVTMYDSCKHRLVGGMYRLQRQGEKIL
jgi:predicted metal-dependent enzyme (double-stranded beta helix superfamily)